MNIKSNWTGLVVALLVGCQSNATPPQSNPSVSDSGGDVKQVFYKKCAGCHGSHLAKPEGRFGDILDLAKVANNPELVIPSQPEQSELWILVDHDEMPPADSPYGALSKPEKQLIRNWIAAGAPADHDSVSESGKAAR